MKKTMIVQNKRGEMIKIDLLWDGQKIAITSNPHTDYYNDDRETIFVDVTHKASGTLLAQYIYKPHAFEWVPTIDQVWDENDYTEARRFVFDMKWENGYYVQLIEEAATQDDIDGLDFVFERWCSGH